MLLPDEVTPDAVAELIAARLGRMPASCSRTASTCSTAALRFPARRRRGAGLAHRPGTRCCARCIARGAGLPAYLAVHRDASGTPGIWPSATRRRWAAARARLWRTTVREETEVDLFGEQAVLCGGMNALVTAAFEALVASGYSPGDRLPRVRPPAQVPRRPAARARRRRDARAGSAARPCSAISPAVHG